MHTSHREPLQLISEGFRALKEHVLAIAEHGILVADLLEEMAGALDANYE
jgi:hypothetical protein